MILLHYQFCNLINKNKWLSSKHWTWPFILLLFKSKLLSELSFNNKNLNTLKTLVELFWQILAQVRLMDLHQICHQIYKKETPQNKWDHLNYEGSINEKLKNDLKIQFFFCMCLPDWFLLFKIVLLISKNVLRQLSKRPHFLFLFAVNFWHVNYCNN